MPDCPKCGTWNPDDKIVCWRCQTELPRPIEQKKRREGPRLWGLPVWVWVLVVFFFAAMFLGQCLLVPGGLGQ